MPTLQLLPAAAVERCHCGSRSAQHNLPRLTARNRLLWSVRSLLLDSSSLRRWAFVKELVTESGREEADEPNLGQAAAVQTRSLRARMPEGQPGPAEERARSMAEATRAGRDLIRIAACLTGVSWCGSGLALCCQSRDIVKLANPWAVQRHAALESKASITRFSSAFSKGSLKTARVSPHQWGPPLLKKLQIIPR